MKVLRKIWIITTLIATLNCGTALGATPKETVVDITNNIDTLLQTVKSNETYITISNFKDECNRYVKAQLDYLQIMSYNTSPNSAGRTWCNKIQNGITTDYGYRVKRIDGAGCLEQLLSEQGQPIYNVVISFGDSGWGHVCYIHAIEDNKVYFTDNWTYGGSGLKAFEPIELDLNTFKKYEEQSNGYMNSLVHFYKEQATMEGTWDSSLGYWRYRFSDGTYAKQEFVDLGRDQKYYFDENGKMLSSSWVAVNGKWYHAAADGHMDLGWQTIDGERYYFYDPSGEMAKNTWVEWNGYDHYLGSDGSELRNINKTIDGVYYEFDSEGNPWQPIAKIEKSQKEDSVKYEEKWVWDETFGFWKYQTKDGSFVKGWRSIDGHRYYFKDDTSMVHSCWFAIDGQEYYFNTDGHMQKNTQAEKDGAKVYLGSNGAIVKNRSLIIGGVSYKADDSGILTPIRKQSSSKESDTRKSSMLKITGETEPGLLHVGDFFGLDGTITSNYPITKVHGSIQDNDGNIIQEIVVYPNTMEYDLDGEVDESLIFNYLSEGRYRYIVVAADSSGKERTLVKRYFTVIE